jgi:hypothetical protein
LNLTTFLPEADYILVPHPWIAIHRNKSYLRYLNNLSKKIPLIMVNTDDISPTCNLQNTLQIRTYLHPNEGSYRKIIIPYPSVAKKFRMRQWKPKPSISFIGYVPKFTLGSLTSKDKNFLLSPFKSSVYLNRRISTKKLENLEHAFYITCIKRKNFSLLSTNSNLNAHMREYENSLLNSDYVLCPRGFGNVSIRFYETLSSGATPILIGTDSGLPKLSIDEFWDDNILVMSLFENWTTKIKEDWNYLSYGNNYMKRQVTNNKMYSEQLDLQKYLEIIFKKYLKDN